MLEHCYGHFSFCYKSIISGTDEDWHWHTVHVVSFMPKVCLKCCGGQDIEKKLSQPRPLLNPRDTITLHTLSFFDLIRSCFYYGFVSLRSHD